MAGIMLIAAVGVGLMMAAAFGNLVICQRQARAIADLAAMQAAVAWHAGEAAAPCALAGEILAVNGGVLGWCVVEFDDVELEARMSTVVPVVPHMAWRSRAGPVPCDG